MNLIHTNTASPFGVVGQRRRAASIDSNGSALASAKPARKVAAARQRRPTRLNTCALILCLLAGAGPLYAQIDPIKRELIQIGFNQPVEGKGPLAAYAFYYRNMPQSFERSNLTLRLAIAPVYVDSELGVHEALGPNTDLGIGLAGGGFAYSYSEVRLGQLIRGESFTGHGASTSVNLYHLFNPESRVPLHGVLRGAIHHVWFTDDSKTDDAFVLPEDQPTYQIRAGLRFGGREPVIMPELAMELSVWYEGAFRAEPGGYGFGNDRRLESSSHRFWARGLLTYTLPESKHNFGINVTTGTGVDLDRFSAYRLGGNLPLYSEFPLSLPGYYFQELSANTFVLFGGGYNLPVDRNHRWWINASASTAYVDFSPGLAEPSHWNTGVGGGVIYRSPSDSWQLSLGYGYGIDAVRNHDRGAHNIAFLAQFDLDRAMKSLFDPSEALPLSRGLQHILRGIFR